MIKSPLRYPGGKSRAINQIINHIPNYFSEYREPFVGGGSLFIYLNQMVPRLNVWINDLNRELYCFWKTTQLELLKLAEEIRFVKASYANGRELFRYMVSLNSDELSEFERAIRFFILNRITFSGTVESGGYSEQAFHHRFTESSIDRLLELAPVLDNIKVTNLDYSELLKGKGEGVFIFLDPPYLSRTKSKLYGKKGDLHTSFDHQRFARELYDCPHQWLITYDDSPEVRELFSFAYIYTWELQYGMNNYKQSNAAKGKELFITNYDASFYLRKREQKAIEQLALNV